jgi:diadenosine tetraphosphate (Ap4A) HIT family hydrolase
MDEDFRLHPQLGADTFPLGDLPLCRCLLMDNAHFPWLILVPRSPNLRELTDLGASDRHRLMDEIALASSALQAEFTPDKLNVAALGNQVPQLHLHVIARFASDACWPAPVWGGPRIPYADPAPALARLKQRLF